MAGSLRQALARGLDAAMAAAGIAFMDAWAVLERGYRRPLSWLSQRIRFAFYPLLGVAMVAWLAWDWQHGRQLDAAEDAVFDQVIQWRPLEPKPSGRVVVVEIDDCSIEHFRAQGEGGWPWSRQRHADLVDALDSAGAAVVGFDILFADPSVVDPEGDAMLERLAAAGDGRFLFASTRLHPDFDRRATLTADRAPGAGPLHAGAARPGPPVALMLPYGEAMARHSGLVNVARAEDGMLRDVRVFEAVGDWALPALPLRLAQRAGHDRDGIRAGVLRVNWRSRSRLPYASAADVIEGRTVCGGDAPMPSLRDAVVLVGHTAAGINDAKPTPVNPAMPGVEVLAEATEALVAGTAIRMPPAWLKYVLAATLVLLTTLAFWRGEPHEDLDAIFVATNLAMLLAAFAGLTFLGVFVDIFASVGYVALCFGLCRSYAAVQRGRVIGNSDYRDEFDAEARPWLLMARLRFVADPSLPPRVARRRRREYRRVLRRFLYASRDVVMIEGVVERKSWLHAILDDLVLLLWQAESESGARALARRDLDALHAVLDGGDERIHDGGRVLVCASASAIDDGDDDDLRGERLRLRELLGQDLNRRDETPLRAANTFIDPGQTPDGAKP